MHGGRVRWLRKRCELEMDELAQHVGVTRAYINKIEVGWSPHVSVGVFRALREALGLTAADSHMITPDSAIDTEEGHT